MKPETATRTALEWLEYEFVKLESTVGVHSSMYHLIEKAMEMERMQIQDAYDAGLFDGSMDDVDNRLHKNYYNETFNTK
jgi:hypothetical protein